MKNNDEMYQSLLSRYEEYQQKKKKRLLVIGRVVPALACFCLAVVLGLGYWNHNSGLPVIPEQPEITEAITVSTAEITQSAQTTTDIKTASAASTTKTTAATANGQSTAVTTVVSETRQTALTEQTTAGNTETQATAATVQSTSTQAFPEPPAITTVTTTEQLTGSVPKVLWGYPDEAKDTGHQSAARTSQNIVMKCDAFCAEGETLTVEAAMGDVGLRPYNYDTSGDYEYDVYVCDPINYKDMEDERFIVNGERKGYRKEFSREELKLLDINGKIDDYDAYHQEITTIDFSDYEAGSSGSIVFKLLEVFDDNSYMGGIRYMYFYKGERGTAISNLSIDNAKNDYDELCHALYNE